MPNIYTHIERDKIIYKKFIINEEKKKIGIQQLQC